MSDFLLDTLANTIQKFTCSFKSNRIKVFLPWITNDIHQLMKKRDLASKKIDIYKITNIYIDF